MTAMTDKYKLQDPTFVGRAHTFARLRMKTICHDCHANPGEYHDMGCDVEQCPDCGRQMIGCHCDEPRETFDEGERLIWTGVWPGTEECIEYGFFNKWVVTGQREYKDQLLEEGDWEPCEAEDPDATLDLGRLLTSTTWDKDSRKYMLTNK